MEIIHLTVSVGPGRSENGRHFPQAGRRILQSWAKEWSLGCVNPASRLPLAAGRKFTQPRSHSFAQPCTYNAICVPRAPDISIRVKIEASASRLWTRTRSGSGASRQAAAQSSTSRSKAWPALSLIQYGRENENGLKLSMYYSGEL